MNKMLRIVMTVAMALTLALPLLSLPALALTTNDLGVNAVGTNISLTNTDPRIIIGRIINVALGFLGVIAVVIILLGGFKWMTAGGNEEAVEEAKKILMAGVIGLVIILASWGIATFVMNSLATAVTN
jgi:hypothetical protein